MIVSAADRRPAPIVEAPAKVNLSLHVVGRRSDGYHRLDGLVVFTELGDRLTVAEAHEDGLDLTGPMAPALSNVENILTKTLEFARALAETNEVAIGRMHLTLEKHLPVAAGIGGGSADAAALLRALRERYPTLSALLEDKCHLLGADVPMCLRSRPVRVSGIGEIVDELPAMPTLPMVLVNPRVAVSTPAVFARLADADGSPPPVMPLAGFGSVEDVAAYLDLCRNDLEAPAISLAPPIGDVLGMLRATNARTVRMSGSGASVFAMFETEDAAAKAAAELSAVRPDWWVVATRAPGTKKAAE